MGTLEQEVLIQSDTNDPGPMTGFTTEREGHTGRLLMNYFLTRNVVSEFQVVGGMPMKVMVAEPKVRKGPRAKKSATKL